MTLTLSQLRSMAGVSQDSAARIDHIHSGLLLWVMDATEDFELAIVAKSARRMAHLAMQSADASGNFHGVGHLSTYTVRDDSQTGYGFHAA